MKKYLLIFVAALLCAAMLACGSKTVEPKAEVPEATEVPVTEAPATEVPETEAPATEVPVTEAPATEAPATEEPAAEETAVPVEKTEEAAYVDFDDMSFWVNGTKFTLGVSTLQDMIDAGVPFDEKDLANAGNNLNPNYQSQGFRIELGKYWSAQVYTMNDTKENKTISECYICEVYLPNHENEQQDILKFAFPLDLTMEQLTANAGEPDDVSHFDGDNGYYSDTLTYKKDSDKYFGYNQFKFEFIKGVLKYVTITYLP